MALDNDQRAWLDAAVNARGRFTREKAVRDDWEAYRRRRAKAATFLAGMPYNAAMRPTVENGLTAADALAKAGKFTNAYKSLATVKAQAKAGTSGRKAGAIAADALNGTAAVIDVKLNAIVANADFAVRHFDSLLLRVAGLPTCDQQRDMSAAFAYLHDFSKNVEPGLKGDLISCQGHVKRSSDAIRAEKLRTVIASAEAEIKTYEQAGLSDAIRESANRIAALKMLSESNGGRYVDAAVMTNFGKAGTNSYETAIKTIKSTAKYQAREGDSTSPDAATDATRRYLKPLESVDAQLLKINAELRAIGIEETIFDAKDTDDTQLTDTGRGPVNTVAELPKFDVGEVLDDLLADDEELPDDLPFDQADRLVAKAGANMRAALTQLRATDPKLTDLILHSKGELAGLCSLAMTGKSDGKGFSPSQAVCFSKMADEMMGAIAQLSPNRMADDQMSITIGGVKYDAQGALGKSKATVQRFVDPITGKAVAVKSVPGSKREELVGEMRTHMRLMNDDPNAPGANNLLQMQGAAIGEGGSLHMVMEVAEGGDMGRANANIKVMEDCGLLSPEARLALNVDMLRQTVMGMKAMEARGLVHNDMKPGNVLLTKDGTVKIMDFGESRIGDVQGNTPSASSGGFGTTGGYEAPEQFKQDSVTSKADSFALGGMMKVLGVDVDPLAKQGPESALGRIAQSLQDKDPDKRPSLDAVLLSSYMTSTKDEHTPEDIADLRIASMALGAAMNGTKATISGPEFDANTDGKIDPAWQSFLLPNNTFGGDVPIGLLKTIPMDFDENLATLRKDPAANKAKIDALLVKRKFWDDKIKGAIDAKRKAGKKEFDDLAKDDKKTIKVPGKGGGDLLAKDALSLRKALQGEIKKKQADFYALVDSDPVAASAQLVGINKELADIDLQITAINVGVEQLMGADGKFFLAEQKLAEVSARFGPRKITPEELAAKASA